MGNERRKRRVGRFSVSGEFICQAELKNEKAVKNRKTIFDSLIVLSARAATDSHGRFLDATEYTAIGDIFDEVDEGNRIPEYQFLFHAEKDGFETAKVSPINTTQWV